GPRHRAIVAVRLCLGLLVVAACSAWPWLGTSAAMATLLALAYGLGGGRLLRAVLPAWAFAGLAVLPPSGFDQALIFKLQALVSHWGSPVLDALGVLHVAEGNVIQVAGHRLLVEQACSGIHSLFAVLGVMLFFVLWEGRKPVGAGLLIIAA